MYRSLLLMLLLLLGCPMLPAQTLEQYRDRLSAPQSTGEQFGTSRVTVTEHDDAARAVAEASRTTQRQRLRGYRVCIFFDNGQDARAGAVAAKNRFVESYPDVKVYMVYENPYFKVSVGNCLTAEEAIILKGRVTPAFPKAFVKSEELTLGDFSD